MGPRHLLLVAVSQISPPGRGSPSAGPGTRIEAKGTKGHTHTHTLEKHRERDTPDCGETEISWALAQAATAGQVHPRACAAACGVAANFFCVEQSCLKRRAEKDHETDVKI